MVEVIMELINIHPIILKVLAFLIMFLIQMIILIQHIRFYLVLHHHHRNSNQLEVLQGGLLLNIEHLQVVIQLLSTKIHHMIQC